MDRRASLAMTNPGTVRAGITPRLAGLPPVSITFVAVESESVAQEIGRADAIGIGVVAADRPVRPFGRRTMQFASFFGIGAPPFF